MFIGFGAFNMKLRCKALHLVSFLHQRSLLGFCEEKWCLAIGCNSCPKPDLCQLSYMPNFKCSEYDVYAGSFPPIDSSINLSIFFLYWRVVIWRLYLLLVGINSYWSLLHDCGSYKCVVCWHQCWQLPQQPVMRASRGWQHHCGYDNVASWCLILP